MPKPTRQARRAVTRVRVSVSPDAFYFMAMSAAEAAIVPPDLTRESFRVLNSWNKERGTLSVRQAPMLPSLVFSETGLETGGVLCGTAERSKEQTEYRIQRAMLSTAIQSDEGLAQSDISFSLFADLAEAAGKPWGTVIGDFHSHVVLDASARDIEDHELYAPSEIDLDGDNPPHCEFSMVITVAWAGRAKRKSLDRPNLVYRRMGDFLFVLTGFRRGAQWSASDPTLQIEMTS